MNPNKLTFFLLFLMIELKHEEKSINTIHSWNKEFRYQEAYLSPLNSIFQYQIKYF